MVSFSFLSFFQYLYLILNKSFYMCEGSSTHRFRSIGVSSHLTLDLCIFCLFLLFLCAFWWFSSRFEASMIQNLEDFIRSKTDLYRKSIIAFVRKANLDSGDISRRPQDVSLIVLYVYPLWIWVYVFISYIFFFLVVIRILYFCRLLKVMESCNSKSSY